jgi:hypothetical protein
VSRLLFAAARGARVQRQQETTNRTGWEDIPTQWGLDDELRTHPEDEHLQYGPISTEFRTLAEDPPLTVAGGGPVVQAYLNKYKHSDEVFVCMPDLEKSLFLLLISEVLADDGL